MPFEKVDDYELDTIHHYFPVVDATKPEVASSRIPTLQIFFIPGNPGSLSFYDNFFSLLCRIASRLFAKKYNIEIHAATHLNHHLSKEEEHNEIHEQTYESYDLKTQIDLTTAFCKKHIKIASYHRDSFAVLIGHR
jgi:hypothetical protein